MYLENALLSRSLNENIDLHYVSMIQATTTHTISMPSLLIYTLLQLLDVADVGCDTKLFGRSGSAL